MAEGIKYDYKTKNQLRRLKSFNVITNNSKFIIRLNNFIKKQ